MYYVRVWTKNLRSTIQTYLVGTCVRTTMEKAPQHLRKMCDDMVYWVSERCEELVRENRHKDMYALYYEWCEFIEEAEPELLVLSDDMSENNEQQIYEYPIEDDGFPEDYLT